MAGAALIAAAAGPASAASIVAQVNDYNGPRRSFPENPDLGWINAFGYEIAAGTVITAAFFEGTYGTAADPYSTAGYDAILDSTQVTVCVHLAANCYQGDLDQPFRAFSIALPDTAFADLLDGYVELRLRQPSTGTIRLGSPTLRIETAEAAVPEPATWGMMLLGFGMLGAGLRARRRNTAVRFA